MNAAHDGYYVPTVKLLRQTRRALLSKKKPGGFLLNRPMKGAALMEKAVAMPLHH